MGRMFRKLAIVAFAGTLSYAAVTDASAEDSGSPLIHRYLEATKAQQNALRDASMEVEINAKIPKWKKVGEAHAMRLISKLGKVTFSAIKLTGDDTVKKEVIARYLEAEQQPHDFQAMAIAPENYKFKYKGLREVDSQHIHVFQLTPRKKAVGLFKGELWLDEATCLPVREAGRFVKSPSFWLKKVEFVREYQIQDGIAVPKRIESSLDTRIAGVAEIGIDFSHFTKGQPQESEPPAALPNSQ